MYIVSAAAAEAPGRAMIPRATQTIKVKYVLIFFTAIPPDVQ
jgi:hypothetical protein